MLHRLAEFSADEILPITAKNRKWIVKWGSKFCTINLHSLRYELFRYSKKCCCCGIEGTVMALEHHSKKKENTMGKKKRKLRKHKRNRFSAHFNLYAKNGDEEILMTKDHILPKSKGGKDTLENLRTMCSRCNSIRGNNEKISLEDLLLVCIECNFDERQCKKKINKIGKVKELLLTLQNF